MSVPNDYIDDPTSDNGGNSFVASNLNSSNGISYQARQRLPSRQDVLFPNPQGPPADYLEVRGPSSQRLQRVYTLNPDSFYYETAVLGSAAVSSNDSLTVNGAAECRCSSSEPMDKVSGVCTKGSNVGSMSANSKSKACSAELVLTTPLHGYAVQHSSCPTCSDGAINVINGNSGTASPSSLESGDMSFITCSCRQRLMRYLLLGALCALLLGIVSVISFFVIDLNSTIENNPSRTDTLNGFPRVLMTSTSLPPPISIANQPSAWYLLCDYLDKTLAENYYKTSCHKKKGRCMARLKSYAKINVAANDSEELRRLYKENIIYVDHLSCLCNDGTSGGPKCTLQLEGHHLRRRRSLVRPYRTI